MGVNMLPDYMIRYELDQETGSISTDEEHIIIGFATQEKKGTLMYLRNSLDVKSEYISVEINNNGVISHIYIIYTIYSLYLFLKYIMYFWFQ